MSADHSASESTLTPSARAFVSLEPALGPASPGAETLGQLLRFLTGHPLERAGEDDRLTGDGAALG